MAQQCVLLYFMPDSGACSKLKRALTRFSHRLLLAVAFPLGVQLQEQPGEGAVLWSVSQNQMPHNSLGFLSHLSGHK